VLSAREAARALAEGFGRAGVAADELPLADGGDGTADVLHAALGGEWRDAEVSDPLWRRVLARFLVLPDGTAVVEAAEAIGLARLAPDELDPMRASSRGLGELILAAAPHARELLVALGGSATVDGGGGLREVLEELSLPTRVACDVANPLLGERGAARAFGPQKGAGPEQVEALERRLAGMAALRPAAELAGAGAAGGLGAALAVLGGELVPGAELVLETLRFRERARGAAVVVTGEGIVDRTSAEGKAPGVALRLCREEDVRCVVFGGHVLEELPGAETHALSGDPVRAADDLASLGEAVGSAL
jgi:glycerate 2-kinase